ncbi:hypothetical protein FRX31_021203 [Thalictrum thalictroides]|uniref:Uncharacterized protein n=1 Tax=Thalictrum thalictroides TaxID=46969 RepID=A0A7J6VVT1_THATH|nr:hypothetical protein FRX31_021203 [Thalictrum thalictroides]
MADDVAYAHPIDKKGKPYILPNLQYQQARKWVLKKSPENVKWEALYKIYLESFKSKSRSRKENFPVEKELEYVPWDLSRENWHVVLDSPRRSNQDMDLYEDPLVFEASGVVSSNLVGNIIDCLEG